MELPRLQALYEKHHDQGLEIVAVDGLRQNERAKAFVAEHNLTFILLENGEGEAEVARRVFDVRAYPTSFLIDRRGRVMFYYLDFGEGDEERLERDLQKLL